MSVNNQYEVVERGLKNIFYSFNENTEVQEFENFISECNIAINYFKLQLKLRLASGTKASIETKIARILSLRAAAHKKIFKAEDDIVFEEVESAFQKRVKTGVVVNLKYLDVGKFMNRSRDVVIKYVNDAIEEFKCLKICIIFNGNFTNKEKIADKHFNSKYVEVCETSDLHAWFKDVATFILSSIEDFEDCGSGWTLTEINNLAILVNKYNPLRHGGASWIDLPKWIKDKKAVINLEVYDDTCFAYAIMSALYPIQKRDRKHHPSRLSSYPDYKGILKFDGINFPVVLKDIPKFEKLNQISVNVFVIEETKKYNPFQIIREVLPIHLTTEEKEKHVNLLLLHDGNTSHYCWIKNLSRLVSAQCSASQRKIFICDRCLHYFYTEEKLNVHRQYCKKINACAVKLPEAQNNTLKFKNFARKIPAPFIIYADTEALLSPVTSETAPKNAYQQHKIYSIGYYLHCGYDATLSRYKSNRSSNCASWFAKELLQIATEVDKVIE